MNKDPNKDLFNFMKTHGFYSEYKDYEEYRVKKFGIGADKDKLREWKDDNLNEKERSQFEYMFEEKGPESSKNGQNEKKEATQLAF